MFICRSGSAEVNSTPKGVIQQEELQGDFAPLLKALAAPGDRAAEGQEICNAVLAYIPVLWLVNAGGATIDALSGLESKLVPGSRQGK